MKTRLVIAACAILLCWPPSASSETPSTELIIQVLKQAWGEKQPRPFSGVGVFDLLRGDSKFEEASCPDQSGTTGELLCRISCNPKKDDLVLLRVRPPSNQDSLAGWVTPPPQDVQMRRCAVEPKLITMQYQDARYALNKISKTLLVTGPDRSIGGNVSEDDEWLIVLGYDSGKLSNIAGKAADTSSGRADLAKVYRFASEGSKLPVPHAKGTEEDLNQALALAKWQLLSKSALLQYQMNKTLPTSQGEKLPLAPTSDLTTYRTNLTTAEQFLNNMRNKSPDQLKLADDIKTLKSLPATGEDAASAAAIIEAWK